MIEGLSSVEVKYFCGTLTFVCYSEFLNIKVFDFKIVVGNLIYKKCMITTIFKFTRDWTDVAYLQTI